jgi:hypothetical protein
MGCKCCISWVVGVAINESLAQHVATEVTHRPIAADVALPAGALDFNTVAALGGGPDSLLADLNTTGLEIARHSENISARVVNTGE